MVRPPWDTLSTIRMAHLSEGSRSVQPGGPGEKRVPQVTGDSVLSQAHQEGLVAVVGAALLQDVEPRRVMGVDTLLGGQVLGWTMPSWSAGMGPGQPWS